MLITAEYYRLLFLTEDSILKKSAILFSVEGFHSLVCVRLTAEVAV